MWHIRLGSPFSEAILQETNIAVFSLNSESCIRETPLQQEKSKLCFSPSLDKGQQMPAELLSQVLRKRIFSTSFLWQPDEKTSIRVSFLFNRKKGKTVFCSNTNSKFILTLDHLQLLQRNTAKKYLRKRSQNNIGNLLMMLAKQIFALLSSLISK